MTLLRFNLYLHCCNFVRSHLLKIALNFASTLPSLPQHCCRCSIGVAVISTLIQTGGTDVGTRCTYGKEDHIARLVARTKKWGTQEHVIRGYCAKSLPFGSTLVQLFFIFYSTSTPLHSVG